MLRIGLTGGIGAGKSTVSATFSELGGIVVDGDVIAREVVEPGTAGLADLVEAFGAEILLPDGALTGPRWPLWPSATTRSARPSTASCTRWSASAVEELIAAAPADAVIVEDIPLLVESQMAPMFPLVDHRERRRGVRVARLIEHRGFSEADARARIGAQATEDQRRAVADVWLDDSGGPDDLGRPAPRSGTTESAVRAERATPGPRTPARRARSRRSDVARAGAPHRRTGCRRRVGTAPSGSTTSGRRPCRAWTPRTSSTFR